MPTHAAVMTGPGAGAIATIQLCGDSAEDVLRAVFQRTGGGPVESTSGRVLPGDIIAGEQTIDQVVVGCESPGVFAIHCHGNPLLVERIMGLLQRHGVQPVRSEQLLAQILSDRGRQDAIGIEAKQTLTTVKTIEGAKIVVNQAKAGLSAKARQWQASLDSGSLDQIAAEAKQILKDSDTARLILTGCTIALVGPPNTGKSTLLNALAGREKAIVTDVRGTTRDWVSAEIHLPPLAATIIDTAGLDSALAATGEIDETAQQKSIEALNRADLILLVLDANQPADQLSASVADILIGRRAVTVLNKADLASRLDPNLLPGHLRHTVPISARQETGLEDLIRAIHRAFGLTAFSPDVTVAFTARQRILMERLAAADTHTEVATFVSELLYGSLEGSMIGGWQSDSQ